MLLLAVIACLTAGLNAQEHAHTYVNNLSSKSIKVTITYSSPDAADDGYADVEISPHNDREDLRHALADSHGLALQSNGPILGICQPWWLQVAIY